MLTNQKTLTELKLLIKTIILEEVGGCFILYKNKILAKFDSEERLNNFLNKNLKIKENPDFKIIK